MQGPIDFIIVAFEGNKFDGKILRALGTAIDKGIIKLVSLTVISKDAKGTVKVVDIADIDDNFTVQFIKKHKAELKEVDKDDIDETGELLAPNSAAGLLIVEHTWAIPLKKALLDAKGVLLADGRIHPEAANELAQS